MFYIVTAFDTSLELGFFSPLASIVLRSHPYHDVPEEGSQKVSAQSGAGAVSHTSS